MPGALAGFSLALRPAQTIAQGDDLFRGTDREPFSNYSLSQLLHFGRIRQRKEGAGMTSAEDTSSYAALNQRRQFHQPQSVGDLRARTANTVCEFVMRAPEVVQQLLVGRRFFERVKLASMQVFQQCVAQQIVIRGGPNDCRDGLQAGSFGSSPASLTHDQLVLGLHVVCGADDDRLQDTDFPDRVHQLSHVFFIENTARLFRVRLNC